MNSKLLGTTLALAAIGASWFGYRSQHPKPSAVEMRMFCNIGEVIAEKATKLAGGKGQVVVWRPKFKTPSAHLDAVVAGFNATIKKEKTLSIIGKEHDLIPKDGNMAGEDTQPVPASRLIELLDKYRQASLVVFFGGVPQVEDVNTSQLPEPCPKIFIVSLGLVDGEPLDARLFNQRIVHALFMPRNTAPQNPNPKTDAERIEEAFMYVTPETAGALK